MSPLAQLKREMKNVKTLPQREQTEALAKAVDRLFGDVIVCKLDALEFLKMAREGRELPEAPPKEIRK